MTNQPDTLVGRIALLTLVSWAGGFIHTVLELPQLGLTSPEHIIPAVISLVLFLAWWRLPYKRLTTLVLLSWALFAQMLIEPHYPQSIHDNQKPNSNVEGENGERSWTGAHSRKCALR